MTDPTVRLVVHAGDDPRRIELLTADLRDALVRDPDLRDQELTVRDTVPTPPEPGSKGAWETTAALLVVGQYFARPAADVLVAAIQSWCARDRRVSVEMSDDDRHVTIVGTPTPQHRKAIEEFRRSAEDRDRS